jgi:threonine/homoserine/homoserine lactone efflux protein
MLPTLLTIWLLHAAALLTPGANVLLVSQLAAAEQQRSAVFAALGITVGALIWSTLAVLGVNTVFAAVPALRLALQIAGGLYLLYVATRLWRASDAAGGAPAAAHSAAHSAAQAFRLGFLTNITNPKSALFFGSVFAASFPADPGAALHIAAVSMVVFNALTWHLLLAFLFSRERVQRLYAMRRLWANRLAAAVVGVLGTKLLISSFREFKP